MGLFRTRTDRLFVRFCRSGDAAALGEVFARTAPELMRVACWLAGNRTDAEDLVQRTFLTAIEARSTYDPTRTTTPWLLGILANHVQRLRRERARAVRPTPRVAAPDPASEASERELRERLAALREELGSPYAEVLRLHLEEGLCAKEIASRLDRPAGTVRTQLVRALARLRERLPNGFVASLTPAFAIDAARTPSVALLGAILMSKKILVALPLTLTALGFLAWLQPWRGESSELRPPRDAGTIALALDAPESRSVTRENLASAREVLEQSARSTASDPGFASLLVRAVWADDGTPASSVGVYATNGHALWSRDGVTDAQGTCRLAHLSPGAWSIGSTQTWSPESVTLRADREETLTLRVARGRIVKGRVIDEHEQPVAGARIWVSLPGDPTWGQELARSDERGEFRVPLCTVHYLGARRSGFGPSRLTMVNSSKPPAAPVELKLHPDGGRLKGRVRDARGNPVPWAKVLVGAEQPRVGDGPDPANRGWLPRGMEVVSDASGVYGADAPAGLCEVRAWAPGHAPFSSAVEIPTQGHVELDIHLDPESRLEGRVSRPDGSPVAGATVTFGSESEFEHGVARTGSDGSYTIGSLPARWVALFAEHGASRVTHGLELARGATGTWNPVLGVGAPVRGRVLDARGAPVADIEVTAWHRHAQKASTRSRKDGSFELLDVGTEPVAIEASSEMTPLRTMSDVRPGTRDLVLKLEDAELPNARIQARLLDEHGRPLKAVLVPWREGTSRARHFASDEKNGRVQVGPLPSGRYRVTIESETHGRQPSIPLELAPGETKDLGDLTLSMPGRCEFVVRAAGKPVPGGYVFLFSEDGGVQQSLNVEHGVARVAAIPPGRYLAMAEFQGLVQSTEIAVTQGAVSHAELDLERTGRLEVALVEANGEACADEKAVLIARRKDGSRAGSFGLALLDGRRRFLVDLPLGHYGIEATAHDGRRSDGEHAITEIATTRQVTLTLPARR